MLPKRITISIDQNMILPVTLMRESSGLKVGLEELLKKVVIEEILCEVFYEFLAGLQLGAVWVEDADLFEEGLGEELVLDVRAVHLLDKGEDLDDLRVALVF